ncbi:MAG: PqqD family protein [Deltaproteobacteria bacterium]|nr:PqqD family protein [Deltaproteobacteria bacterium]MBN2672941.1 PqqD family protein [Deltaproteobacteria bacterium]
MSDFINRSYAPGKTVAFRRIQDKFVLVETKSNNMLMLNGTASDIWGWISEGISLQKIVDSLVNDYHVSEDEATRDTLDFVQTLIEKKLVVPLE